MSNFQISFQDGEYRVLSAAGHPQTPWLLEVGAEGLGIGEHVFRTFSLGEDGLIGLHPTVPEGILDVVPDHSFLLPILRPTSGFPDSLVAETNLFIERIKSYTLPSWFGLSFDPRMGDEVLSRLLDLSPSIIALQNIPAVHQAPRKLVETVSKVRAAIPEDVALYYPGGAPIGFQTLLTSLGVDILDTSSAHMAALDSMKFDDGFIRKGSEEDIADLTLENLEELRRDHRGIRRSGDIQSRLFREMHASPSVASAVRFCMEAPRDLSKVNLGLRRQINFVGDESLHHPVVKSYEKRLVETFVFPDAEVLVLVPCSAKKPYSESKSHRYFEKAMKQAVGRYRGRIALWSLTSPLGVVPQELETVFPAANYDIPVTGHWSREESEYTGGLLKRLLELVPASTKVIVHTSAGYKDMISVGLKGRDHVVSHLGERPASFQALEKLKNELSAHHFESSRTKSKEELKFRKIRALLRWQYGKEFEVLLDGLKFKGRPPRPVSAYRQGIHWFSWDMSRGTIKLSVQAAESSNLKTDKIVVFDGEEISSSSVFAPGVIRAGRTISPGDEVVVMDRDGGEVIALGTAVVSGSTMERIRSGSVVKIRKRKKGRGGRRE